MHATGLLNNRRFVTTLLIMGGLLLAFILASLLVARFLPPTPIVSDAGVVICATIAAFLFVSGWHTIDRQDVSKRVWGLVALSVVLWVAAEITWAFYELVLKMAVPYP